MQGHTSADSDVTLIAQINQLLSPPPPQQLLSYLQEVSRTASGLEVHLDAGGGKGKGLFASKDFEEGEVIFNEPPLVGAQHTANQPHALVCSYCFRYVGSVELQIARRLLNGGISAPVEAHLETTGLDTEFLHRLQAGLEHLPYSQSFPLPEPVACRGGCANDLHCSAACATTAWERHHSLLCCGDSAAITTGSSYHHACRPEQKGKQAVSGTGPASSAVRQPALRAFKQHADATNDIFHVAARVIGNVLLSADALLAQQLTADGEGQSSKQQNWIALQQAWLPFAAGWKAVWWEAVALPPNVSPGNEPAFRTELRELAGESLQLLRAALYDDRFPALFSLQVYGGIIGMFELNNLGIVVASPVEEYFLLVDALPDEERGAAQAVTQPLLDALDTNYDVACEGTAFYALQSCANHSCEPNAHTLKGDRDVDGSAVVSAMRRILKGQEICISYIDEELAFEDRQDALRDYGFECRCPKCMRESSASIKA